MGGSTVTTTTTTSTGTSTEPITCPTSASEPAITGECELLLQDCAPGETCTVSNDGLSTFCRKEGGLKGAGKPCSPHAGLQECQAGYSCVGPEDGVGFCTRPCCPDNDQPCGGGDCNVELSFPGGLTVFMCSYSEQCTLFTASTCKNDQQCQLVYPQQGLAVCTIPAPNKVPEGGACAFVNECDSNQVCFGGFCRYNCNLSGGPSPGQGACPTEQTCNPVYMGTAGDVGVCSP